MREGVLAGMATFVVVQGRGGSGASITSWFTGLNGVEWALVGIAGTITLLAAGAAWFAFYLLQQNGRLLLRLEAVEAKLGIEPSQPAPAPEQGLPVNSHAPGFTVESLEGHKISLEELEAAGKPVLLVFSEPECGACEALLPDLAQSQRGHAGRLKIVVISGGDVAANRAKSTQHDLHNVFLQQDDEVSALYLVTGTPSAVLIRNGVVASALAVGGEAIRALLGRATLPPPVRRGDASPQLRLPDVSGTAVDLAKLRGHRSVLLFWSPACGYCRQILDDLKAWERSRDADSPHLLVISSGSLEEIRRQGFRSRVLVDQNFAAGQVFDVEGTPAAVMIDEEGRVASAVAVGGPDVLALAGATGIGRNEAMPTYS